MQADRLNLSAEAQSVGQARAFVARTLEEWGLDHVVGVATLLTSELATNVVLHARTPYAVVVARTPDGARIDVLDASPDTPARRAHDVASASGRGLTLVDAMARSWGPTPWTDLDGFRKGVRFFVD